MGHHSVAEAKNNLSALIERALSGEDVVITRHGTPIVELKPVTRVSAPITQAEREWLKANRVQRRLDGPDAASLVRQMRDEDWA